MVFAVGYTGKLSPAMKIRYSIVGVRFVLNHEPENVPYLVQLAVFDKFLQATKRVSRDDGSLRVCD